MLILAGITISYVMGDNSVFKKASDAKIQTELGKIEERANLIYTDKLMQNVPDNLSNKPTMQEIVDQLETEGYKIEQVAVSGDAITGISLSRESMTLGFGKTKTIKVTLEGKNEPYTYYAIVDDKYYQMHHNNGNVTVDRMPSEISGGEETPILSAKSSDETVAIATLDSSTNTVNITANDNSKEGSIIVTVAYGNYEKMCVVNVSVESDWEKIAKIAKEIAEGRGQNENNQAVDKNSEQARVTVDGNQETITVGQEFTVKHNGVLRKVRVLGFNHDSLTNPTEAYGSGTTATTAGISFEFVDFMIDSGKPIYETAGYGSNWSETDLRNFLEGTEGIEKISDVCRLNIKQVKKQYIKNSLDASSNNSYSDDKLWLLSCSEIWISQTDSGGEYFPIAKEGEQYKYYQSGNPLKYISAGPRQWWLRSPFFKSGLVFYFCVDGAGVGTIYGHTSNLYVAPAFAL